MLRFILVKNNCFCVDILEEDERTIFTIMGQVFRKCDFVDYVDINHWSFTLDISKEDKWSFGERLFGKFHLKNGIVTSFSMEECEKLSELLKLNNVKDKLYRKRCVFIKVLDEVVECNAILNWEKF